MDQRLNACKLIEIAKFSQAFKQRVPDTPDIAKQLLETLPPIKTLYGNLKLNQAKSANKNASKYPAMNRIPLAKKTEDEPTEYAYVPLGSSYVSAFSFTKPIVQVHNDGTVEKHFEKFRAGDTLYIWQCLDRTQTPFHLSAVIRTQDGECYSFGFGLKHSTLKYTQFKTGIQQIDTMLVNNLGNATGVLYSPDGMFEGKMLYQCIHGLDGAKYVNLVNSVEITEEHVNSMRATFGQLNFPADITKQELLFYAVPEPCDSVKEYTEELADELIKKDGFGGTGKEAASAKEKMAAYITRLTTDDTMPCRYVYAMSYNITHDYVYCRYSSKRTSTKNCASFLDGIFQDSMDCGKLSHRIAVDPSRCRRGSLPVKSCRKTRKSMSRSRTLSPESPQTNYGIL